MGGWKPNTWEGKEKLAICDQAGKRWKKKNCCEPFFFTEYVTSYYCWEIKIYGKLFKIMYYLKALFYVHIYIHIKSDVIFFFKEKINASFTHLFIYLLWDNFIALKSLS